MQRPKRVWLIVIWFVLSGLVTLYQAYKLSTGDFALPVVVEQSSGVFYYLNVIGFQLFSMLAAILMFFRFAVNRWFFLLMFAVGFISLIYVCLSGDIPEEHFANILVGMLVSLVVYGFVAWYAFTLLSGSYYRGSDDEWI